MSLLKEIDRQEKLADCIEASTKRLRMPRRRPRKAEKAAKEKAATEKEEAAKKLKEEKVKTRPRRQRAA